jgi:hypothetical protein
VNAFGVTANALANAGVVTFNSMGLGLQGTIENTGVIQSESNSGGYIGNYDGQTTTLAGGGSVLLNDSGSGILSANAFVNQDNLIHGFGLIAAPLTNNATISSDSSGKGLIIEDIPITNNGTLQAINGGFMTLDTSLTNTGGTILSTGAGSAVQLTDAITGGTLKTAAGGVIFGLNCTLADVTNAGTLMFDTNGGIYLEATINNTGVIESYSGNNAALLMAPGQTAVLTGGGSVLLNNSTASIGPGGGNLINQDNLLHGFGVISTPLTNNATVSADSNGNTLTLESPPETNNGTIQAIGGGILAINTAVSGTGSIVANGGIVNENANVTQPQINATGGTFNLQTGALTTPAFAGTLTQSGGTFTPGSAVTSGTVTGDYNMTSGDLALCLGGPDPATEYSQLIVTGQADLAGSIQVNYLNGFQPTIGETFDLVVASDGITLNSGWAGTLGFDYALVPDNSGDTVLQATFVGPVPEPTGLSFIGHSFAAGGNWQETTAR